jgi:hypothetical protein
MKTERGEFCETVPLKRRPNDANLATIKSSSDFVCVGRMMVTFLCRVLAG